MLSTLNNIFFVIVRLALGGMMVWGGIAKFKKPMPPSTQMIATVQEEGAEELTSDIATLKIRNYIFGLKQTDFFWQMLGVAEILCGLFLISQYLGFVGALMLVPITLNIFFMHLFLEPEDIGELIQTGLLLAANL
ncbi:MAG: DoxX family membrane protein [Thermonemataceae bacterium]